MADFFVNGLSSILQPMIDALPTWTTPEVGAVNSLAYYIRTVDYFVPVAGPISFVFGMLAALPAFLALRFGMMVYAIVRGGGPS